MHQSGRQEPRRDTVAFVSVTGGLGGPSRSLATLLSHLDGSVTRTLMSPVGKFTDMVRDRGSADEHVQLPRWRHLPRISRLFAAARIASWAMKNRKRLLAFHANGQAELNLVGPVSLIFRIPVVVWAHASEASPSTLLFGGLWGKVLPEMTWSAVSRDAQEVLVNSRLVSPQTEVKIVANPIDPNDVVPERRVSHEGINIGYLRGRGITTGFDLIPEVAETLIGSLIRWLVFTSPPGSAAPADQHKTWARMEPLVGPYIEMRGKVPRVDAAYAECDIVFCPSLQESFGRVAAEAMLNGIPIVATDIPPFRRLIGDREAGLLFPVGDARAAADCITELAEDPGLRDRLGLEGMRRAAAFDPGAIANRFLDIYIASGR